MADSSGFNWDAIVDALNQNHIPEIFLIVVGVIALVITYLYLKDRESAEYKTAVTIGIVAGVIMALLCVSSTLKGDLYTLILVAIASFALIIRPFRDVKFAIILALMAMVVVYIALGSMTGSLEALSSGWPRIICAFVVGAIVYMLLGFLQDLVLLFAKIFNAWPVLGILGVICIIEAVCILLGYGSFIDMIVNALKTPNMFC